MHIKQDEGHEKPENMIERKLGLRPIEEVLGDDDIVEKVCVNDVPNNGKRIDFHWSESGVRKLYAEVLRVVKKIGYSGSIAESYARQLVDDFLRSYAKGYIKGRYGIKLEE